MLERRREIGIMKSVGYESRSVLSQVLFENALLGGVGGLSAIALAALATTLLGRIAFKTSLDVAAPLDRDHLASALLASARLRPRGRGSDTGPTAGGASLRVALREQPLASPSAEADWCPCARASA